jgi:amino acid transporter
MQSTGDTDTSAQPQGAGLGTFSGVFTPSILTILGIILFLRTGYVVGNTGLPGALAIIGIATAVSVLTSISLAAIATNINVKGGGDYYLISRTLGLEFGGAIGIVLFVAQSVSVAFYSIGFAEALTSVFGWDHRFLIQLIAAGAVLVLFVFAWAGADVATKLQYVVMALLIAALVSFFIGAIGAFSPSTFSRSWVAPAGSIGFWAAFAIFFPAVTGFTQGVSMSGDLKDPRTSLPSGTFAAVGVSTAIYVGVAVLLAGGVPLVLLADDGGAAMRDLAVFGSLVAIGVVAATLSSAMASFLGGPRILQSLASDRIFPFLNSFASGHGSSNNPRRAALLALIIAVLTIGLGSVNLIAPVVSMFFLISYGLINYATYFEARAASPSFRPRFRFFSKWASLAGAVLCGAAMVLINPIAGGAAIIALFVIYQYLVRREIPERWADASQSHHFRRAVQSIKAMDHELDHARNWRPQILVFSADPSRRSRLLAFAKWMEGHSGLTAAIRIVTGEGIRKRIEADALHQELTTEIEDLALDVHARTVLASEGMNALPVIVQSFGVGMVRANAVLFGWPETDDPARIAGYVGTVQEVARLGVSVVSLSTGEQGWERFASTEESERQIYVWWEESDSGRLALLTAYLCTRDPEWRRATVKLLVAPQDDPQQQAADLELMLDEVRIDAEIVVLPDSSQRAVAAAVEDATLVLVPMHLRRKTLVDPFDEELLSLVSHLPMTAAFHAGSPVVLDTDPSSGIAQEIADAELAVAEAKERLGKLEVQLEQARTALESLEIGSSTSEEVSSAEETLETIHRRAVSARLRVERAELKAKELLDQAR